MRTKKTLNPRAANKPRRNRIRVVVQFAVPRRGLPSAASFRRWAAAVSAFKVNLVVVGRAEGRRLNEKFRRRKKPTNVLSFPDTGDIVLCDPVIRKEARQQGKTLAAHYAHLVVHGILHLRGYDHTTKRQAARMEREEVRRLRRLGFADPYAVE